MNNSTNQRSGVNTRLCCKNKIALEVLREFRVSGSNAYSQTQDLSAAIEESCYNESLEIARVHGILADFSNQGFINIYSQQCYKILSNLPAIANSKSLRSDLHNIAKYSSDELNPEVGRAVREDIEIRRKQVLVKRVSKAYTCSRCGKNETERSNFQSAAGDEDSTVSITCCFCGHKWFK